MLVKKDPAILFPIAIAIEVVLLFCIGAHVSGKLSGVLLFMLLITQMLFLTTWGTIILKHLKSMFFKFFWIPIIVLLLIFNLFIVLQFGPDLNVSIEAFSNNQTLFSIINH